MTSYIPTQELYLIRGDDFELQVELAAAYSEIGADPAGYQGRIVFRRLQSDDVPVLVAATVTPVAGAAADVAATLTFGLTPEQTAALPPDDVYYLVEVRSTDLTQNERILEGKVRVRD